MVTQTDTVELEAIGPLTHLQQHSSTLSSDDKSSIGTIQEPDAPAQIQNDDISAFRASIIMLNASGISFVCSMTTGLLSTGLPMMASSLNLSNALILWPASIYSLTAGCSFILAGAIADAAGSRKVFLLGCLILSLCILACGLSRTGTELIIFRGLQGIAASFCLPTSISILTQTFPSGRRRTRGLAMQGAAQPIGYSAGLFLGGLFADTIGWRWGWYISSVMCVAVFIAGWFSLPKCQRTNLQVPARKQIAVDVDWIGALLASACLGLVSYALAAIASDTSNIRRPTNIVLIVISVALIPAFTFWMNRQERKGNPALIPNSVWKNRHFTSTCAMVFLVGGILNAGEFFFSLFFQKVQLLSALQSSIRFLPNIIIGTLISIGTEAVLHKWNTYYYVLAMSGIATVAPLLMGLMKIEWSYWYMAFWAMSLLPFANDVLFIVGALVIAGNFSENKQALAGSVLNTVYSFGTSVGLGVMALISSSVTDESHYDNKDAVPALLEGYRATFWTCLGLSVLCCLIGTFGLRGIGKIGLKVD
ncbi:general substrate transporter, protein [Acrodontium crateriforme]|uniref:General substrate transporter, protein n=1 Tax=Acrodontium crateriforme TaxID=150365 RepID=A0AAQ3M2L5_9PEZI|nr:general substrate transporter, protein [Acrodontium crateriforme]